MEKSNISGKKRKRKTSSISTSKDTSPISKVKKRKSSQRHSSQENIIVKKRAKNNRNHDNFCWKCHSHCEAGNRRCSTCPRVFHVTCLTKATLFNNEGLCHPCQLKLRDKVPSIPVSELNDLINLVFEIAVQMKSSKMNVMEHIFDWPIFLPENSKLLYLKDLNYIIDKCTIVDFLYKSSSELMEDMQWIYHNCHIIYGRNSHEINTMKNILNQLNEAFDCPSCYTKKQMKDYIFYLHICEVPHPIVLVKHARRSYWPAKCLRVCNGKAHVRFFQSYDKGEYPLGKCYFLSKEYLSNKTEKKSVKKRKAMEELAHYLSHFEELIGHFPYQSENTLFDFQKAEFDIGKLLNERSKHVCSSVQESSSSAVHTQESSEEYEIIDLTGDDNMENVPENFTNESGNSIDKENRTGCQTLLALLQTIMKYDPNLAYSLNSLKDTEPKVQKYVINLTLSCAKSLIHMESLQMEKNEEISKQKNEIEKLKRLVSHLKENCQTYQKISELVEEYRSRISQQENEIKNKNSELDNVKKELTDYEDRLRNAENMTETLKLELDKEKGKNNSLIKVHEQYEKKLLEIKETEKKLKELQKNFKLIDEKYKKALSYLKYYETFMDNHESENYLQMLKDCCSRPNCFNNALQACCYDGQRIAKYCCRECYDRDIDHHQKCKRSCMQQDGATIETIVVERVCQVQKASSS